MFLFWFFIHLIKLFFLLDGLLFGLIVLALMGLGSGKPSDEDDAVDLAGGTRTIGFMFLFFFFIFILCFFLKHLLFL